jgi:hypothetical protein
MGNSGLNQSWNSRNWSWSGQSVPDQVSGPYGRPQSEASVSAGSSRLVGSHHDVRVAECNGHPYNRFKNPDVDDPASEEEEVDGSAEKTICQLADAVLSTTSMCPAQGHSSPKGQHRRQ